MSSHLPKILIISSPHDSHFLPSFYLSNLINKKFEIIYFVENEFHRELVNFNGYNAIGVNDFVNLEYLEIEKDNIATSILKWLILKDNAKNNELTFKKIVHVVNPDIILVDILRGLDFMILKSFFKKKIYYFNPMLSIHKQSGTPGVRDGDWSVNVIKQNFAKRIISNIFSLRSDRTKTGLALLSFIYRLPKMNFYYKQSQYLAFQGVHEFILGAKELEFTSLIKKDWQTYIGLSISESRFSFTNLKFEQFLENFNQNNKKIIYCAFGRYYKGPLIVIYQFIERLLKVVSLESDLQLIVSVNEKVIEAIKLNNKHLKNAVFFSNINQLIFLPRTDLFITHGGHGSVKEAIYAKVPLLVYPLDLNHDQPGNGLKIEFHKIGLKGNIFTDKTATIRKKIKRILFRKEFKQNIENLNLIIAEKYNKEKIAESVLNILSSKD